MIRHIRSLFPAVLAATLLLVAGFGCTPKKVNGPTADAPQGVWQLFRANYCQPAKASGMLVKASLYYTRTEPTRRTNRTLLSMWGDYGGPMRLDVSAGIGKLIAHIREDNTGLLVFYPTEKTAYAHVNPVLGATRLGMPFPFSLAELAKVSMGDFSGLTPEGFVDVTRTKEGFRYTLHGSRAGSIVLDEGGRPIMLEGRTANAYDSARTWHLGIDRYPTDDGPRPLPARLTLATGNGEQGVLRIKSRELKMSPWPDKSMALTLPEGVTLRRLDNGYKAGQQTEIPVVYEDKS
ncbi:hypothetical protein [Pseudodesulfovibrio sp. zrk46]|uniref:hypothetical protein n=1 Tax=Pseudodesulfovibrio sp. zrk46 TaxID=2725288 RepID=UPI001448FFED|nr:hypothetical protein [Pseudodesulfovibrio sp. zrk46]QJB56248.1 hypothetical protein HFN16_07405 [Pseudodesulfovibrio sp. zrk46]